MDSWLWIYSWVNVRNSTLRARMGLSGHNADSEVSLSDLPNIAKLAANSCSWFLDQGSRRATKPMAS